MNTPKANQVIQPVIPTLVQGHYIEQPITNQTVTGTPVISKSEYPMQPFNEQRKWKDGLCDCFSELSICCCTFWCPFQPIAMLYELLMRRGSFWILFSTLGFFWLSYIILDVIGYLVMWSNPGSENHQEASGTLWLMSEVGYWIFWACAFGITWTIRNEVRRKYEIPEQCCREQTHRIGGTFSEDCCCSFWCTPCTICQIWRHVTGGTPAGAMGCSCVKDPEQGCC